jgi:magnesium transporter
VIKKYCIESGKIKETTHNEQIAVFINPDENEKEFIFTNLGIDLHTINSALDPEEPARIDFENNHIELIFKRPKNYSSKDHFMFKVSSMGLFFFQDKILIIMSEDINLFSGKQFNNVMDLRDVFLKIIYNSIYHFIEHLKVINMIADEIETKINKSMENKYLLHMFTLEKSLVYYVSAISSNSFTLDKLKNQAVKMGFQNNHLEFLEDILIENNQAKEQANVYSQVFAGLMDARASIINNNMNLWLKNLTIITISIAIPNFFASLGGMSEVTTITGIENPRIAHLFFFLFSVTLGILTYFIFRKFEKKL